MLRSEGEVKNVSVQRAFFFLIHRYLQERKFLVILEGPQFKGVMPVRKLCLE